MANQGDQEASLGTASFKNVSHQLASICQGNKKSI